MRWFGRARSGAVAVALIAAGTLAAACGTAAAPSAVAHAPSPGVAASQPNTGGPAHGSAALAEAVARRLLASMTFPSGARPVGRGDVPAQLRNPAEVPGSKHLVQRHVIRSVNHPAGWVLRFLRRNVPAGLTADPGLDFSCPSGTVTYRVTFVPAAAGRPAVVASLGPCPTVGMTVGGRSQPDLLGGGPVIALARRLLGVGSR